MFTLKLSQQIKKSTLLFNTGICIVAVLSLWIRLQFFTGDNPMPLNDGGLFYKMIQELIDNHFRIPAYTSYNHENIPYAYPALAFYFAGFINQVFNIDLISIIKYLPLIFNLFAIPCFYFFAKEILESKYQALLATLVFSISKPAYEWLIMGGGLTRSPAYTFSILTLFLFLRGLKSQNWKYILFAGITIGLTASFHLEKAFFAVISVCLITFFYARNKFGIKSIIVAGVVGFVVFSPMFLPVYLQHGIEPYVNAFSAGEFSISKAIAKLTLFNFYSVSPFLDIFGVISLIGFWTVAIKLEKRQIFILFWLVTTVFLNGRSVDRFSIIPLSLLFVYGFTVITTSKTKRVIFNCYTVSTSSSLGVILLLGGIFSSQLVSFINPILLYSISSQDISAMNWIGKNTALDSSFYILPSESWQKDSLGEWFPAISHRKNISTVQATEWLGTYNSNKDFFSKKVEEIKNEDLEKVDFSFIISSNYVYCSEFQFQKIVPYCPPTLPDFDTVYIRDGVVIYQKN